MPSLIDADKTIEKLDCLFKETNVKCLDFMIIGYNHAVADSIAVVKGQPAIDAVEVIRCRECKYRDTETGFCEGRGCPMQLVPDDGFCDKGKRRE